MAPLGGIALQKRIPVNLELADLLGGPGFRHADQGLGNIALGIVLQLVDLPAQGDVDGHHHLFDRRIAIDLVGPRIARQV